MSAIWNRSEMASWIHTDIICANVNLDDAITEARRQDDAWQYYYSRYIRSAEQYIKDIILILSKLF